MEVLSGASAIVFGLALWNEGWWHWLLIAIGAWGLTPFLGAGRVLRKAERDPSVLVHDPDRQRARGRRVWMLLALVYGIYVVGFVLITGDWIGAGVIGLLVGIGTALGQWLVVRRNRT